MSLVPCQVLKANDTFSPLSIHVDPLDGLKPFPWKKLPQCHVQPPCLTPGSVDSGYQNTSHPIVAQYSHPTSDQLLAKTLGVNLHQTTLRPMEWLRGGIEPSKNHSQPDVLALIVNSQIIIASYHGFFSVLEQCPKTVWSILLRNWFTVSLWWCQIIFFHTTHLQQKHTLRTSDEQ